MSDLIITNDGELAPTDQELDAMQDHAAFEIRSMPPREPVRATP